METDAFLSTQLISYFGNKRKLLNLISEGVGHALGRLGRKRCVILDGFSGSGVVSRLLKRRATRLIVNDIEDYARAVSECFLTNEDQCQRAELNQVVRRLNSLREECPDTSGFIERLYAPRNDDQIQVHERAYYTRANARALDTYRRLLNKESERTRRLLIGPLLSAASIHANTSGHFQGFYRNKHTGIGQFGGTNRDHLSRITAPIMLSAPVLSSYDCDLEVFQEDTNQLVRRIDDEIDIAYFDPPYNNTRYGSQYFMLNLIATYVEPPVVSEKSGIPRDWRRSDYNKRRLSFSLMVDLVMLTQAKFILVSFNDEGYISRDEMMKLLGRFGKVDVFESRHRAYQGGKRYTGKKAGMVKERLFLLEKF